jgi:hypothetical protein
MATAKAEGADGTKKKKPKKASITTAGAFVKLALKREKLEADLKEVKAKMKDMEESLIDYFQSHGLSNMKQGDRTVYTHRQVFASMPDKATGTALLKEHGHGDLVKEDVNGQRLSAWVRELLAQAPDDDFDIDSGTLADRLPLPEELRQQIKVSEKWTLRVRKS